MGQDDKKIRWGETTPKPVEKQEKSLHNRSPVEGQL